jgi:hypothetical protein
LMRYQHSDFANHIPVQREAQQGDYFFVRGGCSASNHMH